MPGLVVVVVFTVLLLALRPRSLVIRDGFVVVVVVVAPCILTIYGGLD